MSLATHHELGISSRVEQRLRQGALTQDQVDAFERFLADVDRDLLHHRIITDNPFTRWFARGEATDGQLRHFVQQFSVFSNQFLVAALLRVINAPSLNQARAAKEILLNELGVIYHKPDEAGRSKTESAPADTDRDGDPELVGTEGTVDGGLYRFKAAHFEWLLAVGETLGLGYDDLGQRRHGRPYTLDFCDELKRLFGSEDGQIAEGASFGTENWAAAGFWQELEDGLLHIKQDHLPKLRVAFFTWHNRVEAQHAEHTLEELEGIFFDSDFSRDRFFQGAREVLDAIAVFWDGLEEDRLAGRVI